MSLYAGKTVFSFKQDKMQCECLTLSLTLCVAECGGVRQSECSLFAAVVDDMLMPTAAAAAASLPLLLLALRWERYDEL